MKAKVTLHQPEDSLSFERAWRKGGLFRVVECETACVVPRFVVFDYGASEPSGVYIIEHTGEAHMMVFSPNSGWGKHRYIPLRGTVTMDFT